MVVASAAADWALVETKAMSCSAVIGPRRRMSILSVMHSDNGRFDAVHRWASVNDQRDASAQFVKNVLSGRGADSPEPICAWRGERFPKSRK